MLKQMKSIAMIVIAVVVGMVFTHPIQGQEQRAVKEIHKRYKQTTDPAARREAIIELSKKEPKNLDDANELRAIFSRRDYDETLFEAAIESVKKVKDKKLDSVLIDILKDEKSFVDKAAQKDLQGKTEGELKRRGKNIMFLIMKLGEHKNRNAVPILKEYLNFSNYQYYASDALAKIGDTSSSEQMREKAYKGADVNYAGQGSEEALAVIRDLEDKSKKDQWPKIAKQIIHIRDRNAKPYLKRLFNHENMDVRWEAADKFAALADEDDVLAIAEMSKNQDKIVRAVAIRAMQKIQTVEFGDELIAMLNDPEHNVRRNAAKAIGYKKISRAVPYLEKALRDSEQRANSHSTGSTKYFDEMQVCEESYIALYILTGKKYDYKGKTALIEWQAERQKEHPSFY